MRKSPENFDAGLWQLRVPLLNLAVASHLAILQAGDILGHILLAKRTDLHAIACEPELLAFLHAHKPVVKVMACEISRAAQHLAISSQVGLEMLHGAMHDHGQRSGWKPKTVDDAASHSRMPIDRACDSKHTYHRKLAPGDVVSLGPLHDNSGSIVPPLLARLG